jgi:hypothetical protein
MQAVRVNDFDGTCLDASYARDGEAFWDENHVQETFVAIPDCISLSTIESVLLLSTKYGDDIISINLVDGQKLQIRKVAEDSDPSSAIADAIAELTYENKDPEDISSWQPE